MGPERHPILHDILFARSQIGRLAVYANVTWQQLATRFRAFPTARGSVFSDAGITGRNCVLFSFGGKLFFSETKIYRQGEHHEIFVWDTGPFLLP